MELFTSDCVRIAHADEQTIAAFAKVELQPGEMQTVKFELRANDLSRINAESQRVVEPGEFEGPVGDLKAKFRYVE